ncbi:MAG: LapA family protein [Leptolyngbya sp. BL-A-14]
MALIRLVLLLALAGGLFLLVQFNWTPLQLTFLGVQTPALPLALWILGAIGAGIITNLLITSLFSVSNYFAVRAARSKFRQASRASGFQARSTASEPRSSYARTATSRTADDDADWNNWDGYEEPADRASSRVRSPVDNEPLDDWETEPNDDWDVDEPSDTPRDSRSAGSRVRTDYETKQEPKTSSRQGSVYSYSYREPKDSGVGKAEPVLEKPVVDADYRVIVPPFRPLDPEPTREDPPPEENADDWFDDDDPRSNRDR